MTLRSSRVIGLAGLAFTGIAAVAMLKLPPSKKKIRAATAPRILACKPVLSKV
jgi:hypothetical protein